MQAHPPRRCQGDFYKMTVLALLLSVTLTFYLFYVLIFPERFN